MDNNPIDKNEAETVIEDAVLEPIEEKTEDLGLVEPQDFGMTFNPPEDEVKPELETANPQTEIEVEPEQPKEKEKDPFNDALASIIVSTTDNLYILFITKFVLKNVEFDKSEYLPDKATNLALIAAWSDVLAYYNISSSMHPVGRLLILMLSAYGASFAKAKIVQAQTQANLKNLQNQPPEATIYTMPQTHIEAEKSYEQKAQEAQEVPKMRTRGKDKQKRKPRFDKVGQIN